MWVTAFCLLFLEYNLFLKIGKKEGWVGGEEEGEERVRLYEKLCV